MNDDPPDSTLLGLATSSDRRGYRASQVSLSILAVFIVLCALGAFGVHTSSVSVQASGYTLRVVYPRIARAGLDVELRATVTHAEGFADPIVLAITGDYFTIDEEQGWFPEPSSMTRDGSLLYLTFTPPPRGSTFVVDFDTYIQPSSQRGKSASVELLRRVSDADPIVSVKFSTSLFP